MPSAETTVAESTASSESMGTVRAVQACLVCRGKPRSKPGVETLLRFRFLSSLPREVYLNSSAWCKGQRISICSQESRGFRLSSVICLPYLA